MTPRRTHYRALFALLILLFSLPILNAYVAAGTTSGRPVPDSVAPRENTTVVTGDAHGPGFIAAYAPDGELIYYNDTYERYHDVDPAPGGDLTVEYVASSFLEKTECAGSDSCMRSVYERLDLGTGTVERVYSRTRPLRGSSGIHDIDRLGPSRLLVAEIAQPDSVYIVNTRTGLTEWGWEVQRDYPLTGGGRYPGDFTHLNDVERLHDGRVMVSLRNQDQVVFLDRDEGLQRNWTLGAEDDHNILYEQHNPDYIPESAAGPAVLVADSENSRVVEYQRVGDHWQRTWRWEDIRLQWPRDADRLPSGHTLITDTNGGRVLEVNREGDIVWSVDLPGPYEAERLGTGDESAGGPSATAAGLENRTASAGDGADRDSEGEISVVEQALGKLTAMLIQLKELFPSLLLNGILFVLPNWMSAAEVLALLALLGTVLAWTFAELWWSPYSVRIESPIDVSK